MGQIAEDVVMHTLTNDAGECFTISHAALLDNLAGLGIFDINEADRIIMFSGVFREHIKRAKRLLAALDWLAADKGSEAAKVEYGEARRGLEGDCIYYKFETT